MDLSAALRGVSTDVIDRKATVPVVKMMASNDVQGLIKRVCRDLMHYPDLVSAIGTLTSNYGVSYEALIENASYMEQFIDPASDTMTNKNVSDVIDEIKDAYPDQVGSRITSGPDVDITTGKTLNDFEYLLITKEKEITREEPVITIGGASFAAPHNISMISAAPKGSKTAVNNVMVSCSISENGTADGFPDIKAKVNEPHHAVLLFDTEQSAADQQYNVNTIVKRAGLEETPDFLLCYNIRQLDFRSYKETTDAICGLSAEKFGGVHSIYIDGGADYIASVNDEEQSTEIIQWFTHLSIKYNCPVIIVVHQNPGTTKERGHFGSTGQRKCYGLIEIVKDGDVFTLQPKMLRRAGNSDVPLVQFSYSQAKGYHIQVDAPDRELERALKERGKLKDIALKVFPTHSAYKHKEAISRIMDITHRKLTTAKRMLDDMCGFQYVVNGEDHHYRINMEKVGKVGEGQNDLNDLAGQKGQNGSKDNY